MNIQDRASDFLDNLKRTEDRFTNSGAYKEKLNLQFKLTSVKVDELYVEVFSESDYKELINYIISEIENKNIVFTKDVFDDKKKFLYLGIDMQVTT
jgi:hypothetical protein